MKELTFHQAIKEAMHEELKRDPNVFIIGEDVGLNARNKLSAGFLEEFGPDRIVDTPIAEAVIMGSTFGAALNGMRPIVDMGNVDFMMDAMDSLVTQAVRARYSTDGEAKAPLVIRATCGHSLEAMLMIEAWFMHCPGLKVIFPSTVYDAKGLLKSAVRDNNPVLFLEHGSFGATLKGQVPEDEYTLPIGVSEVKRQGTDITIVAWGRMCHEALAAADDLAKENISAEVVDPRTISPMDQDTIVASVKKTGRLIAVHEACKTGGVGAEIAATVAEKAFSSLKAPIGRLGGLDVPPPFNRALRLLTYPSKADIIDTAKRLVQSK